MRPDSYRDGAPGEPTLRIGKQHVTNSIKLPRERGPVALLHRIELSAVIDQKAEYYI